MLVKRITSLSEDMDFKDCLFIDENSDNIRKWVRYYACDYGDADQVIKEEGLFRPLNWLDEYIDCIFSFKSYFNGFLRHYMKFFHDKMPSPGYILDHYDDLLGEETMLKILTEKYVLSKKEAQTFRERLNTFAKLTHTIGNYMPCPDNEYNKIKGFQGYQHFQDRIDLLYKEINSEEGDIIEKGKKEYYKNWFSEQKEKFFISEMIDVDLNYFCPMKEGRNGKPICYLETADDIRNYSNYMCTVNGLIKKRGNCIIKSCKYI